MYVPTQHYPHIATQWHNKVKAKQHNKTQDNAFLKQELPSGFELLSALYNNRELLGGYRLLLLLLGGGSVVSFAGFGTVIKPVAT